MKDNREEKNQKERKNNKTECNAALNDREINLYRKFLSALRRTLPVNEPDMMGLSSSANSPPRHSRRAAKFHGLFNCRYINRIFKYKQKNDH